MHTLLLELFSEEIPARMQISAASALLEHALSALKAIIQNPNLEGKYFVSPRHMGFIISNIPSVLPAIIEETRGPRINANQNAINGFLSKYDIKSVTDLEIRGDFYYLVQTNENPDIHAEIAIIIQQSLQALVWPKSMRWGSYDIKWVRPLHSIICLLDDKIVPVQFGHLVAGRITYGHRFMASSPLAIQESTSYHKQLEEAYVRIFPHERREIILAQLETAAANLNLRLVHDEELIEEVVGLVEWPVALVAEIDSKFMHLPREVLVTSMRNHQKYFVFKNTHGKIAPYFGIVSNIVAEDNNREIIKGNQRVLRARLSDAEFFWNEDRSKTLISRLEELKFLTFHAEIGSMYEKVQSLEIIAKKLAAQLSVDLDLVVRAVRLAKADLSTEMVREFPELQGIMGRYYALEDGEAPEVAFAVQEHYLPRGAHDAVPEHPVSIVVALAERLDTLNHMFAKNIKPTGSKDPYALRRAALGALRILDINKLNVDLDALGIRTDVQEFLLKKGP